MEKSALISTIETHYDLFRQDEYGTRSNYKYLFTFADDVNRQLAFKPVKNGQYPWAIHDAFALSQSAETYPYKLCIGFDLDLPFERQLPKHYHGFETLRALVANPVLWIPNREGIIPAKIVEDILRRPSLTLVRE
jgi:hypothetical protein